MSYEALLTSYCVASGQTQLCRIKAAIQFLVVVVCFQPEQSVCCCHFFAEQFISSKPINSAICNNTPTVRNDKHSIIFNEGKLTVLYWNQQKGT